MTAVSGTVVACAVCGGVDQQPLFHPARSRGPVVRCRGCGLVYVSPRLDTHALIFDETDLSLESSAAELSLEEVRQSWEWPILGAKEVEWPALNRNSALALDRLEKWVTPPGRLLDFGCGGGFFLSAAQARGWEVGLEPLPGHSTYARTITGARIVSDTSRDDTFEPGSYAAITLRALPRRVWRAQKAG